MVARERMEELLRNEAERAGTTASTGDMLRYQEYPYPMPEPHPDQVDWFELREKYKKEFGDAPVRAGGSEICEASGVGSDLAGEENWDGASSAGYSNDGDPESQRWLEEAEPWKKPGEKPAEKVVEA